MLRLVRIILILLLALGLIMISSSIACEKIINDAHERANVSAHISASLVHNNLERYRALPYVLAQDVDVLETLANRMPKALTNLNHKLEAIATGMQASAIYVIDPQGKVIAASNWREAGSFIGENYHLMLQHIGVIPGRHSENFVAVNASKLSGLYISHQIICQQAEILGSTVLGTRKSNAEIKTTNGAQNSTISAFADQNLVGVIVVKVEFQKLESDWKHQSELAFIADADGVVLIGKQPEGRLCTLTPLSSEATKTMHSTLQFGNTKPIPLTLIDEIVSRIHLLIWSKSNEHYLHVQAPIQTAAGWNLHILEPVGHAIKQTVFAAQIGTTLAELIIAGAWISWRKRQRQRVRREFERIKILNYLEIKVAEYAYELAFSNMQLAREIEEREHTEHRIHHLQDELAQASKLSVLGQIAASVAHEINQPVAAIRSYAENAALLLARHRPKEAQSNMQTITSLTERIGRITSDLRQYAQRPVDNNRDRHADVAATVDSALLLLGARQRHERIAVHIDIQCLLTAAIDPLRLEQILVNILQNAMDALFSIDQPSIWLSASMQVSATPMLKIIVRDNGHGIDTARRMALFTPFATGKPDGLGLGLVISRELAREANGELDAPPSGIEGGAVFVLTLPAA